MVPNRCTERRGVAGIWGVQQPGKAAPSRAPVPHVGLYGATPFLSVLSGDCPCKAFLFLHRRGDRWMQYGNSCVFSSRWPWPQVVVRECGPDMDTNLTCMALGRLHKLKQVRGLGAALNLGLIVLQAQAQTGKESQAGSSSQGPLYGAGPPTQAKAGRGLRPEVRGGSE